MQVAEDNAAKNLNLFMNNDGSCTYKERLRSSDAGRKASKCISTTPPSAHTLPRNRTASKDGFVAIGGGYLNKERIHNVTNVTTPSKGGGLLGVARSIRRTPCKISLSDSDDLISEPFDVPVVSEDVCTPSKLSTSKERPPSSGKDKRNSSSPRKTDRVFPSQKLHNLNGVYGAKSQFLATGLKNLGNICYLNSALQCLANSDSFVRMLLSIKASDDLFTAQGNMITDELRFLIRGLGNSNISPPLISRNP